MFQESNSEGVCRVCMRSEREATKLTSVFNNNGELAEMLELLAGIELTKYWNRQNVLICNLCSVELEKAFHLQQMIKLAEEHFNIELKELDGEITCLGSFGQRANIEYTKNYYDTVEDWNDNMEPHRRQQTKSVIKELHEELWEPQEDLLDNEDKPTEVEDSKEEEDNEDTDSANQSNESLDHTYCKTV